MPAVDLRHIVKSYEKGKVQAVRDVTFTVNEGELFGLIGPDGAGKTSLFRIMTTLILPDSGQASVLGYDVVKDYKMIRQKVGYMPGKFALYQDLTVEENLNFFATLFNTTIKQNYDLIRDIYVQLEPFKKRRAGKLSGGMKQKLALCCALIHKPGILFLDEPTTGVDTVSRKEFWEMLQRLRAQGITILVSTPYMNEANLCERIALIQNGNLLSINTPDQVVKAYNGNLFAIKADEMSRLLKVLREDAAVKSCFSFGDNHHITFVQEGEAGVQQLLQRLAQQHFNGVDIKPVTPDIEDCFIQLMTADA